MAPGDFMQADKLSGKEHQIQPEEVQTQPREEHQIQERFSNARKRREIKALLIHWWNDRCAYCGKSDRILDLEHIIPLARGGTNRMSNLVPSCLDCNRLKGTMTAEEFGFSNVYHKAIRISQDINIKTKKRLNQPDTKDLNLSIIQLIQSGQNPAKICRHLGIKQTTLQYHLNKLKEDGIIIKVGYGTWEVINQAGNSQKSRINTIHVGKQQVQMNLNFFKQDAVRAHAFLFKLKIPKGLRNWTNEKREQFLNNHGIEYLSLNIYGSGQRIIFKNRKVWLTNKSIIIYDTASYFAERSIEAKSIALYKFFSIIKGIERLLHVEFSQDGDYKFKVSRQHYALIKNSLAKQYTEEGKKLEVRTDEGLWFLIDNSYNLNEAETVHPETAMTDNKKMQDFFNSVKGQPEGVTITELLELSSNIQQNQILFSKNALAHVDVIKQLGLRVQDLNVLLKELSKELKK